MAGVAHLHLRDKTCIKTEGDHGSLSEALCLQYHPLERVITITLFRKWKAMALTVDIYCKHCRNALVNEESLDQAEANVATPYPPRTT